MSSKSSILYAVIPVVCGIVIFLLYAFLLPDASIFNGNKSQGSNSEGFAVLSLDESQNDREIQELLYSKGMKGFFSESTQVVPVDDFGSLKMVPLDSFRNEIEKFDPRDDGYAQKLSSFFVRDGKRFFFLPLDTVKGNKTVVLKTQLKNILGDIPYTLTFLERKGSFFWYFIVFAVLAVFTLYLSRSKRLFIYVFPVLLALGSGGISAFVLAAILSGIWELLREPLGELSVGFRYNRMDFDYAGAGMGGLTERLKPFRLNIFLSLLFVVFYIFASFVWAFSPILTAAGFAGFFFCYFLSIKAESSRARKSRHILFIPVPLLPIKVRTFSLFPLLVPFASGALLTLFIPLVFPAKALNPSEYPFIDPQYIVSTEEYNEHMAFQQSFSYKPLNQIQNSGNYRKPLSPTLTEEGYLEYYLGNDGLIAGSTGYPNGWEIELPWLQEEADSKEAPFPLEKLMDFLLQYNQPEKRSYKTIGSEFSVKEWVSVAIIFSICIFDWLWPGIPAGRKKKMDMVGDKRIAA